MTRKTSNYPTWILPLTSPKSAIFANLRFRRNLTRSTYLYDAAVVGVSLFRGVPQYMQKALVVMSDGEDTGSTFNLEKAIANYNRDIRVYSINFWPGGNG
jgi:hypothetical protein